MENRVLVTGGTGFFGRALLRYLKGRKDNEVPEIVVLSREPDRFKNNYPELCTCEWLTIEKADIMSRTSLPWRETFSHVLHAATDSTEGPKLSALQRYRQIIEGTKNILDLAVTSRAKKFLLTSSGGIYGTQPSQIKYIDENWRGSPPLSEVRTAYSQGKRGAEHLCALYKEEYGLETIISRCFTFIGPDIPMNVHFAVGNFIRDAICENEITVHSDGKALRTYMDQRDLAHWLWSLLNKGEGGETYNVGSDEIVSIKELAHLVRNTLAQKKKYE